MNKNSKYLEYYMSSNTSKVIDMIDTVKSEMSSACLQGGSLRPVAGYQSNPMMGPQSPHSAWQFSSNLVKQEPITGGDKNDSGINSGSDFHSSSSPGSDTSGQEMHIPYSASSNAPQNNFYSTPLVPRPNTVLQYNLAMHHSLYNVNLLTPPNSEPLISPKSEPNFNNTEKNDSKDSDTTITPCGSPKDQKDDDPLRNLQLSLEKSGLLPTNFSSKSSEYSLDDDNKSDNEMEQLDEQGLRIPKFNSHGKIKKFKCKQCDFIAITKVDFWEHTKIHIKEDKRLTCPKCPFVTEYKHHLEYHLRNHQGSKPFKCSECNYECVNKGMLSSHKKSHSNIYPYRCADCSYATKYCHSLKLHLRKYTHTQAVVLNPDGTPNPQQVIDVYGTRRGPKLKTQQIFKSAYDTPAPPTEPLLPFQMNQLMTSPFPFLNGFPGALPNPQLLQNIQKLLNQRRDSEESEEPKQESGVLDLSKPGFSGETKNRRKGRAYKLDSLAMNSDEEEDDEMTTTVFSNVEVVENKEGTDEECDKDETVSEKNNNVKSDNNACQYCNISFNDPILYTLHMGYHGYKNPFICNMCGAESTDKVTFFLHIARNPHT